MRKKPILIAAISILVVLAIAVIAFLGISKRDEPQESTKQSPTQQTQQPKKTAEQTFDKSRYSTTEGGSIWVITSKNYPLPKGYAPKELVVPQVLLRLSSSEEQMKLSSVAADPLKQLVAAAKNDGVSLILSSGYRSAATQKQFYDSYVARDGQAAADRYSARPGTSEHQTGLAADMIPASNKCHLEICFGDLPEGKWLAEHAHEHGFIIRYLKDKESITTYQYEPWHIRYVGKDLAAELHKTELTMEEFFNYEN